MLRCGDILVRPGTVRPYVGVDPFSGFGQERFRQLGDLGQSVFLQIQDALGDIRLQGKEAKLRFVLRLLELQRTLGDFALKRRLLQLDLRLRRLKRGRRFFPERVIFVGKVLGALLYFGEAAVVFFVHDVGDVRGRVRRRTPPAFAFGHRAVVPIGFIFQDAAGTHVDDELGVNQASSHASSVLSRVTVENTASSLFPVSANHAPCGISP